MQRDACLHLLILFIQHVALEGEPMVGIQVCVRNRRLVCEYALSVCVCVCLHCILIHSGQVCASLRAKMYLSIQILHVCV